MLRYNGAQVTPQQKHANHPDLQQECFSFVGQQTSLEQAIDLGFADNNLESDFHEDVKSQSHYDPELPTQGFKERASMQMGDDFSDDEDMNVQLPIHQKVPLQKRKSRQSDFISREGSMIKRGQSMRSWKSRHHVLEMTHLDYYSDTSKTKLLGRCNFIFSRPTDIKFSEENEHIEMHIITPSRIWRFNFYSYDERSSWYDDIVRRMKAFEFQRQEQMKGDAMYHTRGTLFNRWDLRHVRLDNYFQFLVYGKLDDVDSYKMTINLFKVTQLESFEDGGFGIELHLEDVVHRFRFASEDNREQWMRTLQGMIVQRDNFLQYEALVEEPCSWDDGEQARFFGEFWQRFAGGQDFPGFKHLSWGILGFQEDPMDTMQETGKLGMTILHLMCSMFEEDLRAIIETPTNYPRLAVCLTTFVRLYREVGHTTNFKRIVCFGGDQNPLENIADMTFCILKRFDKRWRKKNLQLEDLQEACETFLRQLVMCIYDSNCLRALKVTVCRKNLETLPDIRTTMRGKSSTKFGAMFH